MNYPIYLDYAASTPLDPRVSSSMYDTFIHAELFANPTSLHHYGKRAQNVIADARAKVAAVIGAEPEEIVFTSGATEAINLGIKGVAGLYRNRGNHIITAKTEHKAVLDACQYLQKKGYRVSYLTPKANGLIDLDELNAMLSAETILVSLMHVNNETGIIQNLAQIAELTAKKNIFLHIDAAQSIGKLHFNVKEIPIDLISLCAHKSYGPKGIGALYLRKKPRVRVEPLIHGGGHEQGLRSGTLATHQIVGMGVAFELAHHELKKDVTHITNMRNKFLQGLNNISNLHINNDASISVPHILNVRFETMLADAILAKLPQIAASTASACQGKANEGSYVLRAMGFTLEQVKSSIRFSFGRFTTEEEIEKGTRTISNLFAVS